MPPKPKFSKSEIIQAALSLVSEEGIEALTTRNLGKKLGSSARPIFTVFKNMEELQADLRAAAMGRFEEYAQKAMHYVPAFKQMGMQMVLFAKEEPKLYRLLFMQENTGVLSFDDMFAYLGTTAKCCIELICKDYGLTEQEAKILFENVWIYTFGVGVLCATGACRFSEKKLVQMLGTEFMAMMALVKSGRLNAPTPFPSPQKE